MRDNYCPEDRERLLKRLVDSAIIESRLGDMVDEAEYESDAEHGLRLAQMKANSLRVHIQSLLID
jgi:hypothetical protein